jgi:hypothetical protein
MALASNYANPPPQGRLFPVTIGLMQLPRPKNCHAPVIPTARDVTPYTLAMYRKPGTAVRERNPLALGLVVESPLIIAVRATHDLVSAFGSSGHGDASSNMELFLAA